MFRTVIKFSLVAIGIAIVGAGAIFGADYLRYKKSPEYQTYQALQQLKKEVAEDPYGGDTPEETLRLFVSALKQGDTDLAAKYFVLEKQKEWREDLAKIREKGLLDEMIKDLLRTKKSRSDDRQAFFTATNAQNIVSVLINMQRHTNGRWKILDL